MSTRTAPTYRSGHCDIARHGACRGAYGGVDCGCPCHRVDAVEAAAVDHAAAAGVDAWPARDLFAHLRSGRAPHLDDEAALRAVRTVIDLGWRPRASARPTLQGKP